MRKADLGLAIARLETEKARAGHLPTLDAVASLGSSRLSGSGAGSVGTTSSASLGVQLAVPLFAGFAVQNRVKETLALMNALSGWGDEMLRLEPATLMKVMKLGGKIQKLLRDSR